MLNKLSFSFSPRNVTLFARWRFCTLAYKCEMILKSNINCKICYACRCVYIYLLRQTVSGNMILLLSTNILYTKYTCLKFIICFNINISILFFTVRSGLVYKYTWIALKYYIYYELNFVIISWRYQWCNGLPNSSSLFLTHADDRISRGCSLN